MEDKVVNHAVEGPEKNKTPPLLSVGKKAPRNLHILFITPNYNQRHFNIPPNKVPHRKTCRKGKTRSYLKVDPWGNN